MDSDDTIGSRGGGSGLRAVALTGHTRVEGQIDCIDVLPSTSADCPPLIALASSRLEGSTWDGAISLLHAQECATSSSNALTRAAAICPVKYGVPALAWCGVGERPMLAAARDDGDVEVYHLLPSSTATSDDKDKTPQYELTPFTALAEHDDLVSVLAAGREANATMLATGSWDCSVRVWDLGRPASSQRQFLAHVAPITAMAWHPTSTCPAALLASASRDKSVKAWDLRSPKIGDCARLLDAMPHAAVSLAWLPGPSGGEEQVLALGLEDGGVALVDVRRPGALLAERRPHATRAGIVRFSAPSSSSPVLLASGGDDGGVAVTPVVEAAEEDGAAVFGLAESRVIPRLHGDYARALGWLELPGDGSPVLLTGGWDGKVRAVMLPAAASSSSSSSS